MTLEQRYNELCITPSDIFLHLPVLKKYASLSETIVELGTGTGISTIALLMGKPKKLTTYDLVRMREIDDIAGLAKYEKLDFMQIVADDLSLDIPFCDLLFIDSYHTKRQLEQELARHAPRAKKFMIFHNTKTYWERGENAYTQVAGLARNSPEGLKFALMPWMNDHKNWAMDYQSDENNGILVLKNLDYGKDKPKPRAEIIDVSLGARSYDKPEEKNDTPSTPASRGDANIEAMTADPLEISAPAREYVKEPERPQDEEKQDTAAWMGRPRDQAKLEPIHNPAPISKTINRAFPMFFKIEFQRTGKHTAEGNKTGFVIDKPDSNRYLVIMEEPTDGKNCTIISAGDITNIF